LHKSLANCEGWKKKCESEGLTVRLANDEIIQLKFEKNALEEKIKELVKRTQDLVVEKDFMVFSRKEAESKMNRMKD